MISRPALPSLTVRVLSSRSSPSSSVTVVVPSVTEGSVFSLTASYLIRNRKDSKMEQSSLERTIHRIPASRSNVASNKTRLHGRQRVAAYCRVSTDSEEQINSYTAQKAYYTQKIEESPDWELAGIFADEGITGTSMKKRKEFNRMITACKRGGIDLILTKSLSRFARNTVDCLETVRMLKARGIGVIFEKENINTLTESSEFLITLFSGFAQAESESLSSNIQLGIRMAMKEGKVNFHYRSMLGYQRGADGKPEIVPEEAEVVRRIFRRYLEGCSEGQIQRELTQDGIATAKGVKAWSHQIVHNILTNEKYAGDALLQKTFTTDCISKKVKKNTGELPQYYIKDNHPAIIPRDIYQRVQEEMARRTSKRKILQKSGKTEQGKYSAKYALSERLVCGECGSQDGICKLGNPSLFFYGFVFLAIQIKGAQLEVYLLVFQSFDKQFVYNAGTAVPFLVGMDKGYFIFLCIKRTPYKKGCHKNEKGLMLHVKRDY